MQQSGALEVGGATGKAWQACSSSSVAGPAGELVWLAGELLLPDLAAGEGRFGVKDDFGLPLGRSVMPVKFRRRGGHISHSPVAVVKQHEQEQLSEEFI